MSVYRLKKEILTYMYLRAIHLCDNYRCLECGHCVHNIIVDSPRGKTRSKLLYRLPSPQYFGNDYGFVHWRLFFFSNGFRILDLANPTYF